MITPETGGAFTVDIRIGVTDNPQPIVLQLADDTDRDDLKARIDTAISGGEGVCG